MDVTKNTSFEPKYLKLADHTLFSWFYAARNNSDCPILYIECPPIGHEYMSSHRALRHLAFSITDVAELPVLRVDYVDTGDSSSSIEDNVSVGRCVDSIVSVITNLRGLLPELRIGVIGFGMGATFAHLAAQKVEIDRLVLWEPCIKGSRYLRELTLLSGVLGDDDGIVEAGGVRLGDTLASELKQIDLTQGNLKNTSHVLYLHQSGRAPNARFVESLAAVSDCKPVAYSGYEDMITFPTETKIPTDAINTIVQFAQATCPAGNEAIAIQALSTAFEALSTPELKEAFAAERSIRFGPESRLFGILTEPTTVKPNAPTLVFLNCGAEHHVGPHRLYTMFARRMAEQGYTSFRLDIEGIGDSPAFGGNSDNYAYSPVALRDIKYALATLGELGHKHFITTGICAGGYHAFLSAATCTEMSITKAVVINPLVFHWEESNANEQHMAIQQYSELKRYQKLLFNGHAWGKLLRGEVDFFYVLKLFGASVTRRIEKLFTGRKELNGDASKRLLAFRRLSRKLVLIQAEGDPGVDILRDECPDVYGQALRDGSLSVTKIANADHGFSKHFMRVQLFKAFQKALQG